MNKQQTQYITILGIFASIVLTFVGGLAFSTSVLSNIDKANACRLVFVMAFIALFFGNILYLLFLSKISLSKEKKDKQENFCKKPMFWFNLIVTILFVIGFCGELHIIQRLVSIYKA